MRTGTALTAVRVEGGLLSADLIERIRSADPELPGSRPEDYHLAAGERLGDAASRKWEYLIGAYTAFTARLAALAPGDPATTETRERWLLVLLSELGFGRVPYARDGVTADGIRYRISHAWEHVPIHLLGWHTDLDRRTGPGPAGRAPQSLLQDFLNASDRHLWGILSNGRLLRILRDSTALTGAAYIEFDLEAIFGGDLYSEFVLLYALTHQSRFELLPAGDGPATAAGCWLERWRSHGIEAGTRFREQLRGGVEQALCELGTGFLEANPELRDHLAAGRITRHDYRHELLRLIYQLIFLMVAEDRGVLLHPDAAPEQSDRYHQYFSTARLRRIARRRAGDRHSDLWRTLVMVLDALGSDYGLPALGLPALGGLYFRAGKPNGGTGDPAPDLLRDCDLHNTRLLAAIRNLDEVPGSRGRRQRADYRHLGAEELGSVYESLLELEPRHDPATSRFWLERLAGNQRKTTGSYYTPAPLIETLLDSALDPVIDTAAKSGDPEDLLTITVCDPACGSGHFLVAAARRIARRYAAMKHGDDEPPPQAVTAALREVTSRCIYGVDINPLAAELAKVSLWLESIEPGKPLAFLDAHIKTGNALLGATPARLAGGIPDGAFMPLEGDDKKIAASLRKQNEAEHAGQDTLFSEPVVRVGTADLSIQAGKLAAMPSRSLADIREQARRFRELENSPELRRKKQVANAWCAAFVWRKHAEAPEAITTSTLQRLDDGARLPADVADEISRLASRYQFFHWHLEFPGIFRTDEADSPGHSPAPGWHGGFSCVTGNPPWERVKLQEQEFFAAQRPEIAQAPNAAARKKLIRDLASSGEPQDEALLREFQARLRASAGESQFLRESGRYRLTGRGDINTYAVFAETARTLTAPTGRMGVIVPTGIATDNTTAPFFRDIIEHKHLDSLLDFVTNPRLWTEVGHRRYRFSLLVVTGQGSSAGQAEFWTLAKHPDELPPRGSRIRVNAPDLLLVNPNTGTSPMFGSQRDADITLGIYRRVPVLWRDAPGENPWELSFMRMFDMANDSRLFRSRDQLEAEGWTLEGNIFVNGSKRMLPLYEAKLIHHFDHRLACYTKRAPGSQDTELPRLDAAEKSDPNRVPIPRYWVQEYDTINKAKSTPRKKVFDLGVTSRLRKQHWDHGWLLGWRDICRSTDERTVIASVIPRSAVGDKYLLALAERGWLLQANLSAFALDYCARQKYAGSSFKYYLMKQLPVLPPGDYDKPAPWEPSRNLADWITPRVLELNYTAWDMAPFARDLGDTGPPFAWNEERRFWMRAELDAAYFHLYGIERGDIGYILDSFGAFRRNNPERFARTRDAIFDRYDAMTDALDGGIPYRTILDPPPGHGRRHSGTAARSLR